ncbi:MAG: response regulator transcription factor [Oscillochloris sp.]|nr:response regulator transcription factor [Oscillochloris sp.]
MTKLRILLADDHAVVRAGLKVLIEGQPDMMVVGEADNGLEVIARLDECRPDVVVMDLSMPQLSGNETTERIRARCPHLAILILTLHEDVTYVRRLLESGASGYVLKHSAPVSLISAIRQVASGQLYLDPDLGASLLHSVVTHTVQAVGDVSSLSPRELMVLRLIALGYSNKEIAARFQLSVKTIETYKARAMDKLGISSRVEIVRYAANNGWLNQDAP